MSHSVKYFVDHVADVDGNQKTYRIELLEDGFGGSATEKRALGEVFTFEFERVDREEIFDGLAQKGRLELHLAIQNSSDLAILSNIVAGDEDQFQLRLKEDGAIKWTGFVIPDLIEYSEGDYPFAGTITAKDFTILEGIDYPTASDETYKLYIEGLAEIMNVSGIGIGLHSYNDWTELEIANSDDYFNQVYFDQYQLQNFTSYSSGTFESISYKQALDELVPPGYIIRQWDNVWNILGIDSIALNDGIIRRFEYDSTGTQTGTTASVDLNDSIDRVSKFVMPQSVRKPWRASKEIRLEYNHKSAIQNILFQPEYVITGSGGTFLSESLDLGDAENRSLVVSGEVEVTTDTNPGSSRTGNAQIIVSVDDYELDFGDDSWDLNHGEQDILVDGSDNTLTGSFQVTSDTIPTVIGGSGELIIEFRYANVSGEVVQEVRWFNLSLSVNNAENVDNGASNNFKLTQTGDHSSKGELKTIIFGQGPFTDSNSALRFFNDVSSSYDTLGNHFHVGGTNYPYAEFLLKNAMNLKRNTQNSIRATLRALMNPLNVFGYDGDDYFFLGGTLTGDESVWNGDLVSLNWNTGTDNFQSFFKVGESDSGTVIPPSSGTGGTGEYDDRYFRQVNNLSEGDPATIRQNIDVYSTSEADGLFLEEANNLSDLTNITTAQSNLGLRDGSADLDFNSLDINGSAFVDGSRNITGLTLDTGQGANELYPMDQAVRTTDDVAFRNVWAGKAGDTDPGITDTTTFGSAGGLFVGNAGFVVDNDNNRLNIAGLGGIQLWVNENTGTSFNAIDIDITGTIDLFNTLNGVDIDLSSTLDVDGVGTFGSNIIMTAGDIESNNFSSWFSANPTGWQATYAGVGDFRTLYIDELIAKAFTVDVAQALAGSDILTKSVAILAEDFVVPSVGSTVTIRVEDLPGLSDFRTFESSDWVRFRVVDRTNGLLIADVWGQVSNYTDQSSGEQTWTFTVDYAGPSGGGVGQTIHKGAIVLDYGQSGDTYIERTVLDRSSTSDFSKVPYDRIVRWTGNDPRTGSKEVLHQRGNLNGLADYTSSTYGTLIGSENADYMTSDPIDGLRFFDSAGNLGAQFKNGLLSITNGSGIGNFIDTEQQLYNVMPNPSIEGNFVQHIPKPKVSDVAHSGNLSIRAISTAQSNAQGDVIFDLGTANGSIDGREGDTYTIGLWAYNTDSHNLQIGFWGGGGFGVLNIASNPAWVFYQTTFTIPSGATLPLSFRIREDLSTITLDGSLYIDDIVIVRGDIDLSGDLIPYKVQGSEIAADVTSNQFSQTLANIDDATGRGLAGLDNSGNVQRILSGANLTSGSVSAAGLYATSTNWGYYDGTSWNAYIENDGSFFFESPAGKGISFDAGTGIAAADFSEFNLEAGGDYWRTSDQTGSVGGGILTWDGVANTVGIANFTAESNRLTGVFSGQTVSMGVMSINTQFIGFGIEQDTNNRLIMSEVGGDFELQARVGGDFLMRLGSRSNRIASSYFDATGIWGGDPLKANADILLDFANQLIYIPSDTPVDTRIDNGRLRMEHSTQALDRMWVGYGPNFTQLDGDALGVMVSDPLNTGTGSNSPLRSAVTWAEMGFRNSGDTDWILHAHYQDGLTLKDINVPTYKIDTATLSAGEDTLNITAPVMEITSADASSRVVEITVNGQVPTPGQEFTVINSAGGVNFGWRDSSQTSHIGANISSDDSANYDHRHGTRMTLSVGQAGAVYISNDHGA